MKNTLQYLFLILNLIINTSFSQHEADSTNSGRTFGVIGTPFLSYAPETEWSFGIAGLFYFHLEKPNKEVNRLSNIFTDFHYTTKKQFSIKSEYDFYFIKDTYRLYGDIAYSKFPFQFFGIGNNTLESNEEDYTPKYTRFEINLIRKIFTIENGKLNSGFRYDFRDDNILKTESNGKLESENIPGKNGGIVSGLGININFDSRDNSFSTTSGEYLDFKSTFYRSLVGSDYSFDRFTIDLRKFYSIYILDTTHVFAAQIFTDFTNGNVPFYLLPTYGGENNLRGIYNGRFRDNNSFFLQGEYRFPVFWRIGLAVFGGIGEAFHQINDYSLNKLKFAGGFGIRGSVIPKEKISIRIDFGFSKYKSEFYLSFNEAF